MSALEFTHISDSQPAEYLHKICGDEKSTSIPDNFKAYLIMLCGIFDDGKISYLS